MNKLYDNQNIHKFIVYNRHKSNKKARYDIIFLHGLMTDMHGTKAMYIKDYCINNNLNFIGFDNFGHGKSSGNFIDQTIGSWLHGIEMVLNNLVIQPVILVASSMGAWIALLAAIKLNQNRSNINICGIICIAPALDFTHDIIWDNLSSVQKKQMQDNGSIEITNSKCTHAYPISYNLITEAEKHLLLKHDLIQLNCNVHLIHGMLDEDINYSISLKLLNKITSNKTVLKLIKDGDHKLSRISDLHVITNSINEIIAQY